MPTFLVETYQPRGCDTEGLRELESRARAAAVELSRSGASVRYLRAILVPEDETCFYVFEALAREQVLEAAARAGLMGARITETLETREPLAEPHVQRKREER